MVLKKRGASATAAKKVPNKKKCDENKDDKVQRSDLSLPVISEEKFYNDNYVLKTSPNNVGDKASKPIVPKITIKCKPLNIEKIIDYENNKVYVKNIRADKKSKTVKGRSKSENKTELPPVKKPLPTAVKRPRNAKKSVIPSSQPEETTRCLRRKKPKTSNNEGLQPNKKESPQNNSNQIHVQIVEETKFDEQNSQATASQGLLDPLNLDSIIQDNQALSLMEDNSDFIDLSNINLDELDLQSDEISNTHVNMNSEKSFVEGNENPVNELTNIQKNKDPRVKNCLDQNNLNKKSLLTVVESFLKNPLLKQLKGKTDLKKGLCISWFSNRECLNKKCLYNHNAQNLFVKKLKRFPSKFIITEVVSMRNDLLFVDVVMAAFKVICDRKVPVVWVTFLTFFVFYVSEPSDSRFLKFWASAARFFCELKENYSTARGFASLLSIFSQGGNSEEWKIIEFIKLIRQPPVQVRINFALLQPVLKMELPCELLMEAVELSIATQQEVLKVYSFIIPKISIPKAPIHFVELLLKFCKILEGMNHKNFADDLKQRLKGKVLSFKTKVSQREFPVTAAFQEEIYVDTNEGCTDYESCPYMGLMPDFERENFEDNYFQPEEDFFDLLYETVELSPNIFPNPYGRQEDISERQLLRIKQFCRDCRFDLLGKYINDLKPDVVDRAAEEFLKSLFQMKISLQQGVDLVKIILLACKTENAAKVISSVSITLILNLVKINEWNKAYTILSFCQGKNINLVEGKVFYFNKLNVVTQCRIVLLLIEILSFKGNYASAVALVRKHFLFSSNNYSWQLSWKEQDETIRVRIVEDLLYQVTRKQLTEEAYDLFQMIWREQKQLVGAIDLKKFVNEILILLLNEGSEEAINLYEEIKNDIKLHDITVRAVLVSLVRQNFFSAAKYLVLSTVQTAYSVSDITSSSTVIKVYSFWLEEEIYVVFDVFFDSLIAYTPSMNDLDYNNFEIQLLESKWNVSVGVRPLCLGIINPSFKEACTRIQRVLQSEFNPPVKLIIMPYSLKLEENSVRLHLQKRMSLKRT